METFLLNLLKTSLLGSLAILAMLVLKPLWRERHPRENALLAVAGAGGIFGCCRSIFR